MKKIALIAHNLRSAGTRVAGIKVLETLPRVAPTHEYFVVYPEDEGFPTEWPANVQSLSMPRMSVFRRAFWEHKQLYPALRAFEPNWIWCLGTLGLLNPPGRQSILLRDAHYVNYPLRHSQYRLRDVRTLTRSITLSLLIRRAFQHAHRVYCQTETMRNRVHETYRRDMDSIGLCPMGVGVSVDDDCTPPPEVEKRADSFRFLYVSRCMRHKNMHRIVEAFEKHREALSGVTCFLTVDEKQNAEAKRLCKRIEASNLQSNIICLGAIPYSEIGRYYRAADAVIFPTLLETVGAAHLEAMTFQRPLLASDLDFAHELCGEAALYVDPFSADSIANGMIRLRDDAALRENLASQGAQRVKEFVRPWKDILLDVLRQEGIE